MNKEQYFKYHSDCCTKMVEITKAKNADYTGTSDDPFANFTRVEVLGNCSTEQGFVTRMIDKISRVISFVQKGIFEVKDETVEDTLIDLANYCILFSAYIKHKKESRIFRMDLEKENHEIVLWKPWNPGNKSP